MARQWTDEYTLLCERCGYVIEGLTDDARCPECGKPVVESLPGARTGSAWQRDPGWRSAARAAVQAIRRPRESLDQLRPDARGGQELAYRYALASSAVFATTAAGMHGAWALIHANPAGSAGQGVAWLVVYAVAYFALFGALQLGLLALTGIECRGLRFFGARRGFRVSPAVAWSIVGHGSAGWLLTSVAVSTALVVLFSAALLDGAVWSGRALVTDGGRALRLVVGITVGGLAAIGAAGFLFFEVYAYLGLRRCRFANRARPGSAADAPGPGPGPGPGVH